MRPGGAGGCRAVFANNRDDVDVERREPARSPSTAMRVAFAPAIAAEQAALASFDDESCWAPAPSGDGGYRSCAAGPA